MGIENITGKILDEANVNAETAIKNAETRSLEIISEAKLQAQTIMNTLAEKAEKEAEGLKNRKISAAELQKRKMMLSAKQDSIKKGFDVALEKLKEMPEDKYINFMADEIIKIPNCEGTIILNEKDKEKIGEKLVKAVNDRLKEEKLTLSNNTVKSSGGFVLKNGKIEVNSTFETLLDAIRDELTYDVANVLFK
ncbi:MAG: V-type ATP synthase subunit E [Sedimentibacter sp.]